MRQATVHIQFVTPCFLGGADPKTAEWRAASIRGQLRWWFRAVAGGVYGGDLERTKAAEAEVFGSTGRRSRLTVRTLGNPGQWAAGSAWPVSRGLKAADLAREWKADPSDQATLRRLAISVSGDREIPTDALQYLSYGCVGHHRGKGLLLDRSCFAPGEEAAVRLVWDDRGAGSGEEELERLFGRALWAWLHLGGLGSKSRNGFGSLRCSAIEGSLPPGGETLKLPASRSELVAGVREVVAFSAKTGVPAQKAGWTQFGQDSTVHVGETVQESWDDALAEVGAWLVAYRRRYGISSETRSRDGTSIANRDYTWATAGASSPRGGIPDRAGFGLPLPFGQRGETTTWWFPGDEKAPVDHRRAAPLQIHIAVVAEGCVPVLTHLPAQLIPDGAELAYTGHGKPSGKPAAAQKGIVGHFLDDLAAKKLVRKVAP